MTYNVEMNLQKVRMLVKGRNLESYVCEAYMADFLVSQSAIVLQDVVVCGTGSNGDLLCNRL